MSICVNLCLRGHEQRPERVRCDNPTLGHALTLRPVWGFLWLAAFFEGLRLFTLKLE